MKLHDINRQFLHLERWVNMPKYSATAQYSEVEKCYHPREGDADFPLPVFLLPRKEVVVHNARPDRAIRELIFCDKEVSFFCHPNALDEFAGCPGFSSLSREERATPTSSTRTVMLLDSREQFMVKLHLNKRISRFIRRLTASSVSHSVQISRECERLAMLPGCPREFAYLPESIGVVHKGKGVGFIVREFLPRPVRLSPGTLVPFFALYSRDERAPNDAPILSQLAGAVGMDPLKYFMRHILDPFMKCWAFAFLEGGILFESHAQNTLLELDEQFIPRRIVQRDFQSIPIDPVIRKGKGLSIPFRKHIIGGEDYPRLIEHSLIFDHFIGDYLFGAFAEFFLREHRIPNKEFFSVVQKSFRAHIPRVIEREFFPKGHVTFTDTFKDNICPLLYLHEAPLCRPSY